MQIASSRIWTWVAVSIYNNGNHYTTSTFKSIHIYLDISMRICMHLLPLLLTQLAGAVEYADYISAEG